MILISHRGNVNGKIIEKENTIDYIENCISLGFEVEIDVWVIDNKIFLGHDSPKDIVSIDWLKKFEDVLWVHCKNTDAVVFFKDTEFNFFWHEEDTLTLTSKGFLWVYPGKQPISKSIAVMPELYQDNIDECIGVCSDYIINYKL